VKLTIHLHIVPRSRKRVIIPPLPQSAFRVWCSVRGITGTTLPFTFTGIKPFPVQLKCLGMATATSAVLAEVRL